MARVTILWRKILGRGDGGAATFRSTVGTESPLRTLPFGRRRRGGFAATPKVTIPWRVRFFGRAAFSATACPTLLLGSRVRLATLRSAATLLLPLGGLPTPDQHRAWRHLTVTLVPAARTIDPAATVPQTRPRSKSTPSGGIQLTEVMLEVSQGRSCSRGPPGRLA